MLGYVATQEHYGQPVKVNLLSEALRSSECLCLSCGGLTECGIATTFYEVCKDRHVALMVTRCPEYRLAVETGPCPWCRAVAGREPCPHLPAEASDKHDRSKVGEANEKQTKEEEAEVCQGCFDPCCGCRTDCQGLVNSVCVARGITMGRPVGRPADGGCGCGCGGGGAQGSVRAGLLMEEVAEMQADHERRLRREADEEVPRGECGCPGCRNARGDWP